mmetsp:Transcript_31922/g.67112  ORF Transcript_31922/g.67112 Transcript_31922/m.67112 type:complete len:244 (+) Transcript_31922:116-847(+)
MHFHFPLHLSRGRNLLNLHLFEEDWVSAITEIECHPNETRVWSTRPGFFDGEHESHVLPIHVACSLHAPLEVVRAIVEAYPECLSMKESAFKRLPIQVACQFAAPLDVIEYLAQEYVAGTLEPDILGRLPIHYACSNGAPMDVVQALLRANPASALYEDFNGWLPLHVAVHFGASTEVVNELIRVCPVAVTMKTKKQSTALSLAEKISTKNRQEVITMLRGAMPVEKCDTRQLSFVRTVSKAA